MAVYPVRLFGDPILREKSIEVKGIDREIKVLARNMAHTMNEAYGVGLAAPQIGVLKQLIVIDMDEDGFAVYINPVIKERSKEETTEDEGCLCLPEIRVPVTRSEKVIVEALDMQGRTVVIEAGELLSRIFQHELDHLAGHTILDRTEPAARQIAIREFMEMQAGS